MANDSENKHLNDVERRLKGILLVVTVTLVIIVATVATGCSAPPEPAADAAELARIEAFLQKCDTVADCADGMVCSASDSDVMPRRCTTVCQSRLDCDGLVPGGAAGCDDVEHICVQWCGTLECPSELPYCAAGVCAESCGAFGSESCWRADGQAL